MTIATVTVCDAIHANISTSRSGQAAGYATGSGRRPLDRPRTGRRTPARSASTSPPSTPRWTSCATSWTWNGARPPSRTARRGARPQRRTVAAGKRPRAAAPRHLHEPVRPSRPVVNALIAGGITEGPRPVDRPLGHHPGAGPPHPSSRSPAGPVPGHRRASTATPGPTTCRCSAGRGWMRCPGIRSCRRASGTASTWTPGSSPSRSSPPSWGPCPSALLRMTAVHYEDVRRPAGPRTRTPSTPGPGPRPRRCPRASSSSWTDL